MCRIETVLDAFEAYEELFDEVLNWPRPAWLREAHELWLKPVPPVIARVAVPIWRDPWMAVGSHTFTGDLLRHLGWQNTFADDEARSPRATPEEIERSRPDLVLLPDEPYVFTPDDGPEAFTVPTRLISGRLLTWYGPSLLEAAELP